MITLNDEELFIQAFIDVWFTNCDARYRPLKGARETGKTYNFIGLESIFKILSDDRRNIMMVRQNDKDNANSNFTIIKNICGRLGIRHLFDFKVSPHKIVRKDTGQVILFGGMNDVENITSTSVETGYWTDIYFEEASQLKSYEEFRVVDGSLRLPNSEDAKGLFCQITFCFNAWDVGHWLYDVFFKGNLEDNIEELENKHYQFKYLPDFNIGNGSGLALHISASMCNPYLTEDKIKSIMQLKEVAYEIYKVERLGCWGHIGDATYPYFTDRNIIPHEVAAKLNYAMFTLGVDIGGTNGETKVVKENYRSAMTMTLGGITSDYCKNVTINEFFYTNEGKTVHKEGPEIADMMINQIIEWKQMYASNPTLMKGRILVYVESADPGDFQGLLRAKAKEKGLFDVMFINSTKNKIQSRVDFDNLMMAYGDRLISDACKNLIREYKAAKKSEEGFCRADGNDHTLNADEYRWIPCLPRIKRYKDFKER